MWHFMNNKKNSNHTFLFVTLELFSRVNGIITPDQKSSHIPAGPAPAPSRSWTSQGTGNYGTPVWSTSPRSSCIFSRSPASPAEESETLGSYNSADLNDTSHVSGFGRLIRLWLTQTRSFVSIISNWHSRMNKGILWNPQNSIEMLQNINHLMLENVSIKRCVADVQKYWSNRHEWVYILQQSQKNKCMYE